MGSKCRRFEGKTALITGAAAGMGRATVQRLADEGLETVILVDRDISGATVEKEKVEACGGRAYVLECDVADPASVVSMGKEAEKLVDHLDVIVNSAGIGLPEAGGLELPVENFLTTWESLMNINLRGTLLVAQATLPLIKKNGGAIVNISSDGGHRGRKGALVYDAGKAGVTQATKSMACELVEYGIRVNDVAPGWAATEFHFAKAPDPVTRRRELLEMKAETCIMRRLARPEEIAAGIAYLASDDASFVTGTTLFIDGGRVGLETR